MPTRLLLPSLSLLLAASACRSSETGATLPSYADEASLPTCTEAQHLKVVYTAAEDGLWLCRQGKGWTRLLATGPSGQDGQQGPQGEPGAQGQQGSAGPAGQQGPQGEQGPQGSAGDAGEAGLSTLSRVTEEAAGARCPAGGHKVELGLDSDGNRTLSDAEVLQTVYVCDGCVPESDAAFCDRLAACGSTSGVDACNAPRTANCRCGELEDPNFLRAPDAWRIEGAASVEPGTSVTLFGQPSLTTLGVGRFHAAGLSSPQFGRLFQEIRMPAPSPSGPNAVSITAGLMQAPVTLRSSLQGTVFLGTGARYQSVGSLVGGTLRTNLCLGEAALAAGKKRFTVAAHGSGLFGPAQDVFVDTAALVHDENCPAPGTLLNGDFEKLPSMEWPTAGWAFEYNSSSSTEAGFLFTGSNAGVPLSGTVSGVLRRFDACGDVPSMSTPVSIPAVGGKRLQAKVQGQGTGHVVLRLEGMPLDSRPLSAVASPGVTLSACVPAAHAGTVRTVTLSMDTPPSALCGPELSEVLVDDVALVDDPACPAGAAGFPNGGAESGSAGWYPHPDGTGSVQYFSAPSDPSNARTGNGYARVSVDQSCYGRALTVPFVVPARAATGGGMAVKFAHQMEAGLSLYANVPGTFQEFPAAPGSWSDVAMCLPAGMDGFDALLQLSVVGPGGLCGPITPLVARLDDLRVEPDAACP
ncbi:MAG: hypothetical protein RL653_722 [Pseudomonadota bacterium]